MDRVLAEFDEVSEISTATPGASAWKARDRQTGHSVLIKRLPPDPQTKTRATQALSLNHPNIVKTFRWLRDVPGVYIVRDYVPGRNLRSLLTDASQRAFDRLQLRLNPILDAIDHAHHSGFAHGAVTPENVIIGDNDAPILSDFATAAHGVHPHDGYVPRSYLDSHGLPTERADFYALCQIYKEFLPDRTADDEAGASARARLLKNLSEMQQTTATVDELRYKLDAVSKMANLLGFSSRPPEPENRKGARLVCAVYPATAILNSGAGATVSLTVGNEGDSPLRIEGVGADVVWVNPQARFQAFVLPPDTERDLPWSVSGARLRPGTYSANLIVRSNHGLITEKPTEGTPWHEQKVALPVLVNDPAAGSGAPVPPGPVPLAERLPAEPVSGTPLGPMPPDRFGGGQPNTAAASPVPAAAAESPGIAVTQEPDPAVTRGDQVAILHLSITNIGPDRLRIDRITTWPSWLLYPGVFQALWIEPGATQRMGLSIIPANLPGGDYRAQVTFLTSTTTQTLVGAKPLWRDLRCDVRVRVVRGFGPNGQAPAGAGCATLILGVLAGCASVAGLAFAALH